MTSSRALGIVWIDFCMLLVLGFISMVIMLLPFINPPTKAEEGTNPPGNLIVAIYWPEGNVDVDLWLYGPGERAAVGYSNKAGVLFNLLRDDLGDPDNQRNYENGYSRGTPAGEYIINVHCYRCSVVPVAVEIEVSINDGVPGKAKLRKLLTTKAMLTHHGHEKTAIRFKLDDAARIVANSMNSIDRPLRAMKAASGANDYGAQ